MFLNDDGEENSSQWAYAFSTFVGTVVILGWLGSTFGRINLRTEPWDPIDPSLQRRDAGPNVNKKQPAYPQQKGRR